MTRLPASDRGDHALIADLRSSNLVGGIRLVDGAALALRYRDGIVIHVAAKEAMLAMKLRANRPGRDTNDIRQLLALCRVTTLDEAEELYEDFYPGDALTDRAVAMVNAILDGGLPEQVPTPGPIEL